MKSIKERIVRWLFRGITINALHTRKIYIIGGHTAYIDLLDMDHKTSDGSPTESQMWYNSTDATMKYRTDSATIEF